MLNKCTRTFSKYLSVVFLLSLTLSSRQYHQRWDIAVSAFQSTSSTLTSTRQMAIVTTGAKRREDCLSSSAFFVRSPISSLSPSNNNHNNRQNTKQRKNNTYLEATPLSTAIAAAATTRGIDSYFLTRILFLRGLAFVYFFAFLIALHQNKGLIGDNSITPGKFNILFIYILQYVTVVMI